MILQGTSIPERGQSMKHYRLLAILILTLSRLLAPKISCLAIQYDYTPLETLSEEADKSNYIKLSLNESYRVNPGDTLWGISRQFLGSGARYEEIIQANQDSIRNSYTFPKTNMIGVGSYPKAGFILHRRTWWSITFS